MNQKRSSLRLYASYRRGSPYSLCLRRSTPSDSWWTRCRHKSRHGSKVWPRATGFVPEVATSATLLLLISRLNGPCSASTSTFNSPTYLASQTHEPDDSILYSIPIQYRHREIHSRGRRSLPFLSPQASESPGSFSYIFLSDICFPLGGVQAVRKQRVRGPLELVQAPTRHCPTVFPEGI